MLHFPKTVQMKKQTHLLKLYSYCSCCERALIIYFYFEQFTKREPEDTKSADSDRDIFNEKPSKEEVMAATQAEGPKRVSDSAIIHTTMGDIHIKLFPVEYVLFYHFIAVWLEKPVCLFVYLFIFLLRCPKTVENFCVHSRNGYYNSHIFHRVIKVWAPVECLDVYLRICGWLQMWVERVTSHV